MEIKFLNITIKRKNKVITKNLNITAKDKRIIGVYNDSEDLLKKLLSKKLSYSGKILIDKKELKSIEDDKISFFNTSYSFLTKTVSDEFYLIKKDMDDANYIQKVVSSLNMVGLSKEYLEKELANLSKSEKQLLKIALTLVKNKDILFLEEPFLYLDKTYKEKIKKILLELKKKYEKTIFIVDKNIDNLYSLCDDLIVFKENQILIGSTRNVVFQDLDFLIENDIELPSILKFSFIAKNFDKKIPYFKDINDLIKEVYRNASETKEKV